MFTAELVEEDDRNSPTVAKHGGETEHISQSDEVAIDSAKNGKLLVEKLCNRLRHKQVSVKLKYYVLHVITESHMLDEVDENDCFIELPDKSIFPLSKFPDNSCFSEKYRGFLGVITVDLSRLNSKKHG